MNNFDLPKKEPKIIRPVYYPKSIFETFNSICGVQGYSLNEVLIKLVTQFNEVNKHILENNQLKNKSHD